MNLPDWVDSPSEELRYHMRRAALFHNPSGSLERLSIACGYSAPMASRLLVTGRCTRKFALAVEALVGRDVVSREQLAPHEFCDGEGVL